MNKIRICLLFVALFAISFCLFSSAKAENPKKSIETLSPKVVAGVMVFDNREEAYELLDALSEFSDEEIYEWESKLGFRSMFGLMHEVEMNDEKYYQNYIDKGYSTDKIIEMLKSGDIERYSPFTRQLIAQGVLKSIVEKDGSMFLDVAIEPNFNLRFVNVDGFYAVDGKIYLQQKESLKIITDGDFAKIGELDNIVESNEAMQVEVMHMISQDNSKSDPTGTQYRGEIDIVEGTGDNGECWGCYQLYSVVRLTRYWIRSLSSGWSGQVELSVNNVTRKRNWWRQWYVVDDQKAIVNGSISRGQSVYVGCNGQEPEYSGQYGTNDRIVNREIFESIILYTHHTPVISSWCDPLTVGLADQYRMDLSAVHLEVEMDRPGDNYEPYILLDAVNCGSSEDIDMN